MKWPKLKDYLRNRNLEHRTTTNFNKAIFVNAKPSTYTRTLDTITEYDSEEESNQYKEVVDNLSSISLDTCVKNYNCCCQTGRNYDSTIEKENDVNYGWMLPEDDGNNEDIITSNISFNTNDWNVPFASPSTYFKDEETQTSTSDVLMKCDQNETVYEDARSSIQSNDELKIEMETCNNYESVDSNYPQQDLNENISLKSGSFKDENQPGEQNGNEKLELNSMPKRFDQKSSKDLYKLCYDLNEEIICDWTKNKNSPNKNQNFSNSNLTISSTNDSKSSLKKIKAIVSNFDILRVFKKKKLNKSSSNEEIPCKIKYKKMKSNSV